jgi:4-alpha-glucanotransferase
MWWDSYPYSTVSVHALHPQYLALRACGDDGAPVPAAALAEVGSP